MKKRISKRFSATALSVLARHTTTAFVQTDNAIRNTIHVAVDNEIIADDVPIADTSLEQPEQIDNSNKKYMGDSNPVGSAATLI